MSGLAMCALVFAGCSENESQVQELRQLREKLAAAEKKTAEALEAAQQAAATQAVPATSGAQESADSVQKLALAETRIASLEKELLEARNTVPPAARGNAESFREFVKSMERDLLAKTGELQQSVEQAVPAANIQETTVKRLRLPEQIASALSSAIVFSVPDSAGGTRRLEFPVQAGLDGQWRLPGVADVRQHITASAAPAAASDPAQAQPARAPAAPVAAADPHTPVSLPSPATASAQPLGGSNFQQGGPPTVVINWGASPGQVPPLKAQPPTPAAIQPPPVATTAKPPPVAAPTVPKPIMPVQQSVQIRFE
ncbi:hypothetical protein [Prosthecobacter sp.]|uniref:hypothetical protein n=1 Tax=Prosthecobacter sp. TaxID=1965333 RepID=UPI002ABCA0C7|nr:hypothetical protein [Prosthecobacter sp.]MDZ4405002.1 hypothetical protein [Prosthecobacter sp.]